jgi:S-phase kinase-associated protein 1
MSHTPPSSEERIVLISEEGRSFLIPAEAAASQSELLKGLLDVAPLCPGGIRTIPLPLSGDHLPKVIEWAVFHHLYRDLPETDAKVRQFREDYWVTSTIEELAAIILLGEALLVPSLTDDGCRQVSFMLKGKTAEQIRTLFGLENDWTPEALAEAQRHFGPLTDVSAHLG